MLSSGTRRTILRSTSRGGPAAASVTSSNLTPSNNNHQLEQRRTLLGLVHAIDKRVYRWAKGVLPPISKTENIALGCGTIGEFSSAINENTSCVSLWLIGEMVLSNFSNHRLSFLLILF
jgi:hypothetical protein